MVKGLDADMPYFLSGDLTSLLFSQPCLSQLWSCDLVLHEMREIATVFSESIESTDLNTVSCLSCSVVVVIYQVPFMFTPLTVFWPCRQHPIS